ncbi:MAG: hypothetical protein HFG47_06715 [Lachnospiraceae bacterium]|nr:hypothetical protein [Lachnospiraceae bacterium]
MQEQSCRKKSQEEAAGRSLREESCRKREENKDDEEMDEEIQDEEQADGQMGQLNHRDGAACGVRGSA